MTVDIQQKALQGSFPKLTNKGNEQNLMTI